MPGILVVDDDVNTCLLYQKDLSEEGYRITTATNAKAGLDCFRKDHPDLIVLDIRMPGKNGLELLEQILSIDHHVPIILNTGYASYKSDFCTWLADDYVVKSSDLTELKRRIARLLRSRATAGAA